MVKKPLFTVDLEDYWHGLHIDQGYHTSLPCIWWLEYKLDQYKVKAIFYVLGRFSDEVPGMVKALKSCGHIMRSHGYYHNRSEKADRKPYSWLGFIGGFYFRFLPYWFVKWQVMRKGMFYIHPHDLDEDHPKLKNPWFNWKRHVGLKTARAKLERLLTEVKFDDPNTYEGL